MPAIMGSKSTIVSNPSTNAEVNIAIVAANVANQLGGFTTNSSSINANVFETTTCNTNNGSNSVVYTVTTSTTQTNGTAITIKTITVQDINTATPVGITTIETILPGSNYISKVDMLKAIDEINKPTIVGLACKTTQRNLVQNLSIIASTR
jgi:hypothetical protein